MKRCRTLLILFVLLLSALPVSAILSQAPVASGKAAFQQLVDEIDDAEKHKDLAAWTRLIEANSTPDTSYSVSGQPTYLLPQILAEERTSLSATLYFIVDHEDVVSFDVHGNRATALTTQHIVDLILDPDGQYGPKGAIHHLEMRSTITYSLVWSKGSWKIQSAVQGPQPYTVDGKPAT